MNQYSTDELQHYGVLGMKWGRRRAKRPMSQDAKDAQHLKKKKVSELSNAELKKLNERQNLEKNHRSLNPSNIARGAKAVAITAAALGTIVSLKTNGKQIIEMGKDVTNMVLKRH